MELFLAGVNRVDEVLELACHNVALVTKAGPLGQSTAQSVDLSGLGGRRYFTRIERKALRRLASENEHICGANL